MITIIDYGMGNLRSVEKAFEMFCKHVKVSSSYEDIITSDKVVLPGVGSFDVAMDELRKRDLIGPILETINKKKPFLGVCLGLQLLFTESDEGGRVKGLGVLKGRVIRFNPDSRLKIPHMGWNSVRIVKKTQPAILKGIARESYMYFVHSYFAQPEDGEIVICETEYSETFASGIKKDNIFAFQFHPEKSQRNGLKIVENFVRL